MVTQVGVGISHHRNPRQAGYEAAQQALNIANITKPDFILLFSTVGYSPRTLLDSVRSTLGYAPLIGCSGEGVIVQGEADESNFSVAVMVVQSAQIRLSYGAVPGLSQDSAVVGNRVGQFLAQHDSSDAIANFLFADGISCDFDQLISALEDQFNRANQVPLLGGLSADNYAMTRTYQYCDDTILTDGVVWATLAGKAQVAWSISHGCVPLGNKYTVTRSQNNQIFELDHQPALEILRQYLLDEELENWELALRNLGLGLKSQDAFQNFDAFFVRSMIARNLETGSITIPTEISAGTDVWMMRRDQGKTQAGIHKIAAELLEALGESTPQFVIQLECAGRVGDTQKRALLATLQSAIGPTVPWIGFYPYGGIGPLNGQNCFHNHADIVIVLY